MSKWYLKLPIIKNEHCRQNGIKLSLSCGNNRYGASIVS